ncbi:RPL22 [Sanghuangporus sanghuang]|uniref:Ribosomal protein L22e n=1 Tax=Sanghuangporus baumii TaxID=108892 RepID=A0A9Q5HTF8_SANBA|nr:ribosomal protein L22e [Sanghuangporus baumii]
MTSLVHPSRALKMPKAAAKTSATKHKFFIDFSKPANDGVFDGGDFEKFLHDKLKVDGKPGNLGESVKITKEGQKVVVTSSIPLSKRYLKYLTKKFLKKKELRDWIRVIAASKDGYELRFYNIAKDEEEEEDE